MSATRSDAAEAETVGASTKRNWRRRVLTLLVAIVVIYLVALSVVYVSQRRFIYLPDTRNADLATVGAVELMEAVELSTDDGLRVISWFRRPAGPARPMLVLFQGNAGNIGDRLHKVATFVEAGWGVMLVGYRGFGGNPGKPTEQGLYADARAALRLVQDRGIAAGRIVLYGESLGSGVATEIALETEAGALILEAPFTSIADMAQRQFPYFPSRWLVLDRFDNAGKIGRVGMPVLVLHGALDPITPVEFGRRVFDAANQPKAFRIFPDAGHVDLFEHGAAEAVLNFIDGAIVAVEPAESARKPG